jgi:hypothetical protein
MKAAVSELIPVSNSRADSMDDTMLPQTLLAAVSNVTDTTVSFSVMVNETCTGYRFIQDADDQVPDIRSVMKKGTRMILMPRQEESIRIGGLTQDTTYRVHFVPMDRAGNVGKLETVSFITKLPIARENAVDTAWPETP